MNTFACFTFTRHIFRVFVTNAFAFRTENLPGPKSYGHFVVFVFAGDLYILFFRGGGVCVGESLVDGVQSIIFRFRFYFESWIEGLDPTWQVSRKRKAN